MVGFIQVCVTAVQALTECWLEAPLGYLGPFIALATPVDSWETLTWSFLGPQGHQA